MYNLTTVQLTLESTEKIETSAPKISSSIRTSSALAVITFQPVSTNSNYEFQVSYYNNSNSSATPDLVCKHKITLLVVSGDQTLANGAS